MGITVSTHYPKMSLPVLYISQALQKLKPKGGYLELSGNIQAANGGSASLTIDRRKLKATADGKPFTISLDELVVLDNYLSLHGEGLGDRPLFVRQSILEGLSKNRRIAFLLGAFQRDEEIRNDVSLWDVKAFQEVLTGIHKFRDDIQDNIQEVSFFNEKGEHNKNPRACEDILAKKRQSVCAIGSPRSSIASEILLSEMLQVQPFSRPKRQLPFKFVWPEDEARKESLFASAFVAGHKDLAASEPELASLIERRKASALIVGETVFKVIPKKGKAWDDFAIIAVQEKSDDRVRLVIAGMTGVTTYAAAIGCRTKLNVAIPECSGGQDSPVLLAVIKVKVKERPEGIGDVRYIESVELAQQPQYWPQPV